MSPFLFPRGYCKFTAFGIYNPNAKLLKKMKKEKAGLLPVYYNRDDKKWYCFLGHPTPVTSKNRWEIIKGGIKKGESALEGALREFKEEALCSDILNGGPMHSPSPSFNISPDFTHQMDIQRAGAYETNKSRVTIFYGVDVRRHEEIENAVYRSNEFKHNGIYYPEVQNWKYFTFEKAVKIVNKHQIPILEKIFHKICNPNQVISYTQISQFQKDRF